MNDNFRAMIAATRARQQRAKHPECKGRQIVPEGLSYTSSSVQFPNDEALKVEPENTISRTLSVHASNPSALSPVVGEHPRAINQVHLSMIQPDDFVCEWESADPPAPVAPLHSASKSHQTISFPEVSGSRHPSTSTDIISTRKRRRIVVSGPWTCPKCTYYNEKFVDRQAKCEMGCGGSRPKSDDP